MTDEQTGALMESVRNMTKSLEMLSQKMDTSLKFQASTEERLKNGNKHFEAHDKKIESIAVTQVEDCTKIREINIRCKNECEKRPSAKAIYSLIIAGFIVLAFLVSLSVWHHPVVTTAESQAVGKVLK